ncbi:MAG: hypothetical protein IPM25_00870 [Chloracidobacterium sp.]|nr:hypothetical protein [Chloracidobacterium sp.]
MKRAQAQNFLPIEGTDKKVELAIHEDQVVLSLSTWTEGLGWCGQKTMSLDAEMIDDMHRLLGAARVRLALRRAESADDAEASGEVISFPASIR